MRYPLQLSRSGDFIEGLVDLPRGVTSTTDLGLPVGERPALYEASKAVVGQEAEFELMDEQAWAAIQLSKSHRYWAYIKSLIAAGKLALMPGAMPQLATKSAGGLYTRLPLVEWHIEPLRVAGGTYAVKAAELVRRFEDEGMTLPQSTWDALDAAVVAEALEAERNYR